MERKKSSKQRGMNVLLSKLSPDLQRQIKKPLFKRSSPLRQSNLKPAKPAKAANEITEELRNSIEQDQLDHSLKPTLERPASKETESSIVKDIKVNDRKFETTFGFSHGIDRNNGGILVRKTPNYKGLSKQLQQQESAAQKDKKQMQICFSLASKASTVMPNVLTDSSYKMIANMEHGYDATGNRRSPIKSHLLNKDIKSIAPPSDLTSYLFIMDELNKSGGRETPISILDSVDLKPSLAPPIAKDLP